MPEQSIFAARIALLYAAKAQREVLREQRAQRRLQARIAAVAAVAAVSTSPMPDSVPPPERKRTGGAMRRAEEVKPRRHASGGEATVGQHAPALEPAPHVTLRDSGAVWYRPKERHG